MEIIAGVLGVFAYVAFIMLILKSGEELTIRSIVLAPWTITGIVYGKQWYLTAILLTIFALFIAANILYSVTLILVSIGVTIAWFLVFNLSLARVWSDSAAFTIIMFLILILVPSIGWIILGIVAKSEAYKGYINFFWFLTREGWEH